MPRDFLLEIGSEEIPAGYIMPALEELGRKFAGWLGDCAVPHGEISAWATPRRLVLRVMTLGERQPDREREVSGPPVKVAYDVSGRPTPALTGFARSQGVSPESLVKVATPRGEYLAARIREAGRDTRELLRESIPPLVASLAFPKSMRWEAPGIRFARPIRWVLALWDDEVVPLELAGLVAGRTTRGHRFLASGPVTVPRAGEHASLLRRAGVVVDQEERRRMIAEGVAAAAAPVGGRVREDEELLDTVTFLVEMPLPVLASFDRSFLELPSEVVTTALREHQRYFCVEEGGGELLPHFVAVGNGGPGVAEAVRRGAERVVAARLADARFYWREDLRRPLADRVADLARVVWQEELGSLAEKTERLVALAGAIAEAVDAAAAGAARRAAFLAKADLTTEMIKDGKEFTTLQGVMGEAYARASGEPDEVARAVFEHYLPRFAGDRLPATAAGALVSIADKMDTVVGCLGVGLGPTGAGDPFALRRQAQGIVAIMADRSYEISLDWVVDRTLDGFGERFAARRESLRAEALAFLSQRISFWLEGEGLGGEVARAVLAATPYAVGESRRRAQALSEFREDPDFTALALGFKRVRNILKGVGETPALRPDLLVEEAEKKLAEACRRAREEVAPLIAAGEHRAALLGLVVLRQPIDRFFDEVLVMDKDETRRHNRLALLKELSALFLLFADFSLMAIPGEAKGEP